jgi:hypothetical protein
VRLNPSTPAVAISSDSADDPPVSITQIHLMPCRPPDMSIGRSFRFVDFADWVWPDGNGTDLWIGRSMRAETALRLSSDAQGRALRASILAALESVQIGRRANG